MCKSNQPCYRDIRLTNCGRQGQGPVFTQINQNHAAYMPLHYTLLFLHGDSRYHWGMKLSNPENQVRTQLSQRAFYGYHLHSQYLRLSCLFYVKRLFQQYIGDAWAVVDQNKLDWLRYHQDNIRANVYNGLADGLAQDNVNFGCLGCHVILLSSYTGGNQYIQ